MINLTLWQQDILKSRNTYNRVITNPCVGKTTLAQYIMLEEALRNPGSKCIYFNWSNLAYGTFNELRQKAKEEYGLIPIKVIGSSIMWLEFDNGSLFRCFSHIDQARGHQADIIIVDDINLDEHNRYLSAVAKKEFWIFRRSNNYNFEV